MKIRPEQLRDHANAPVALIHGAEPLLILEAAEQFRKALQQQGELERELFTIEAGFDWAGVLETASSGSLFAPRRLLEIRLGEAKPGDKGSRVLCELATLASNDLILLVTAAKLDQSAQNSRWFKTLDRAGVNLTFWPLNGRQLSAWLEQRMRSRGIQAEQELIQLLAQRCEGNLLAAAQEIDNMSLWLDQGRIDSQKWLELCNDQARFSIYDLADAALIGDAQRFMRIVKSLQTDGTEIILASWAVHRDIQCLNQILFDVRSGLAIPAALARHKVWEKRKMLFTQALKRIDDRKCRQLLIHCAELDSVNKGMQSGDAWQLLQRLGLQLCGQLIS